MQSPLHPSVLVEQVCLAPNQPALLTFTIKLPDARKATSHIVPAQTTATDH